MEVERVLRRQAGVISWSQAVGAGVSSSTIGRLVGSRAWVRLHPRVYLAADHELTAEARVWAAALWAGPGAVVSGLAAAWWHRLRAEPPFTVDVTVPHRRQRAAVPGIRVRRRDLTSADLTEVGGLRVTAVPLTVLEASVALAPRGDRLLDRALQRRVDLTDLYEAHKRNRGRHGASAAAGMLRAAADRAASAAERILVGLLRDAGLTGWLCGHWVGQYRVDIAFPAAWLAIEVDGWAWHSDAERFAHDRRRQNALVLSGWTVLRFTWYDLTQRPTDVITEIRAALAARPAPST